MENFVKKLTTALLAYAVQRDMPIDILCRQSAIDEEAFSKQPGYIVTPPQMNNLWRNASQMSGDDLFGLHFGESMQLAALGIIGQIVQSSATIGEALTHAGGLLSLITDMFQMKVHHYQKTFTIQLFADQEKARQFTFTYRHMGEYLLAFLLHEVDGLLLQKIEPLSASFPYALSEPREYERVLRCPVHVKKGDFLITMPLAYLSLPIITSHYELQQQLLQQVGTMLPSGQKTGTLRHRIFHYLLTNAYLYALSLEAVASNFNMSPRTLQRKLKEEGITFLDIVEEVRKTLAINYLSTGNYQIKEVAYVLGYNESSAFVRAFKRWTGKTPANYHAKKL